MKKTNLLDHTTTVDGKPMTLHEHDGVVMIRIDGQELMSTRQHDSEERIAQLACAHITPPFPDACVLIGGLGLGFTLRAALKSLAADAAVLVAEIMPAVIQWNLNAQYNLGRDAMADPRVNMIQADVADVLHQSPGRFDSIILDIDNGASGMSVESNRRLYEAAGLQMARSALKAHGCLAVWSASDDPAFVQRMRQCGFRVTVERARTHPTGNAHNALFIGRVP